MRGRRCSRRVPWDAVDTGSVVAAVAAIGLRCVPPRRGAYGKVVFTLVALAVLRQACKRTVPVTVPIHLETKWQ